MKSFINQHKHKIIDSAFNQIKVKYNISKKTFLILMFQIALDFNFKMLFAKKYKNKWMIFLKKNQFRKCLENLL